MELTITCKLFFRRLAEKSLNLFSRHNQEQVATHYASHLARTRNVADHLFLHRATEHLLRLSTRKQISPGVPTQTLANLELDFTRSSIVE